jgi:hypothetical protein
VAMEIAFSTVLNQFMVMQERIQKLYEIWRQNLLLGAIMIVILRTPTNIVLQQLVKAWKVLMNKKYLKVKSRSENFYVVLHTTQEWKWGSFFLSTLM